MPSAIAIARWRRWVRGLAQHKTPTPPTPIPIDKLVAKLRRLSTKKEKK